MRKHTKGILAIMLILTVCMTVFAPAVFAEEVTLGGINITIEQNEHPAAHDEAYNVVIKGIDGAPMPEGAADGEYTVVISNSDTVPFPEITYNHQGVYEYTISQTAGTTERWTYDDSVYYMTVYVINDDNGNMVVQSVICKDETNSVTKYDNIIFTNIYAPIDATVTFELKKTVGITKKGKLVDFIAPETGLFAFELKDETGAVVQTVSNTDAAIIFDAISYNAAGTYTYTVTEIQSVARDFKYNELTIPKADVAFDKDTVTITVEVYLEDGDYAANVLYQQEDTSVADDLAENEFLNVVTSIVVGDSSNLTIWFVLFGVSLVAVIALLVIGKKRKNQ